jgi:hypothetical protein
MQHKRMLLTCTNFFSKLQLCSIKECYLNVQTFSQKLQLWSINYLEFNFVPHFKQFWVVLLLVILSIFLNFARTLKALLLSLQLTTFFVHEKTISSINSLRSFIKKTSFVDVVGSSLSFLFS